MVSDLSLYTLNLNSFANMKMIHDVRKISCGMHLHEFVAENGRHDSQKDVAFFLGSRSCDLTRSYPRKGNPTKEITPT